MIRVRAPQDLGAAFIFLTIGLAGLALGAKLPGMRAGGQLGSGTMPSILSMLCLGFSALMLLRALKVDGPGLAAVPWRSLAVVTAAVVVFGVLVERVGYGPTAVITPLVASFALPKPRWREAILVSVLLGIGTTLLFIGALGQPLKVWGGTP